MGYRSEVGYAIATGSVEDRDRVIAAVPAERWDAIKGQVILGDTLIAFYECSAKWYCSRLFGAESSPDVDAHEELLRVAEDLDLDHDSSCGVSGVRSAGIFIRLGDEMGDVEENAWGGGDGLPYPYDLLSISRSIRTGW